MARLVKRNPRPRAIDRLTEALRSGLAQSGIRARTQAQPIPGTRLHRVYVVSPGFKKVRPGERQEIVWRIAERTLDADDQLRISMIVTVTPDELRGKVA